MLALPSSIVTRKETQMFKTLLPALATSAALAAPAAAQCFPQYDWQERRILSSQFAATAARGAAQYAYSTGFAGPCAGPFIANAYNSTYVQTMNFNANLPYNGGFGCGYPYPTPVYVGGCAPVYAPAPVYGGGGWSVGVSVGFGGRW